MPRPSSSARWQESQDRAIRGRQARIPAISGPRDRFLRVPKWSLWRRVAGATGQVLACLAHRHARPAGGGADIGDRREQGVLPEVVGLPPGDLIQQVRFGPAVEGRCGQHRILELAVLPARNVRSGRNRSRSPSKGSGSARLAPHQSSACHALLDHLARETDTLLAAELTQAITRLDPTAQERARARQVLATLLRLPTSQTEHQLRPLLAATRQNPGLAAWLADMSLFSWPAQEADK
jgi:hypothetical protein